MLLILLLPLCQYQARQLAPQGSGSAAPAAPAPVPMQTPAHPPVSMCLPATQDFMADLGSSKVDGGAPVQELRAAATRSLYKGSSGSHPVWGAGTAEHSRCLPLLQFLCRAEVERLRVWAHPLSSADSGATGEQRCCACTGTAAGTTGR
jgi:hypothetical protein